MKEIHEVLKADRGASAKHLKRFGFIDVLEKINFFKRDSNKALQLGGKVLPIEMCNSVTFEFQLLQKFALRTYFSNVAGGPECNRDVLLLFARDKKRNSR
jgi:hypothetical protein